MGDMYWNGYLNWLMNVCDIPGSHVELCELLHNIDVFIVNDMDINRIEDGVAQREYFIEKMNWDLQNLADKELSSHKCSFFEMICALAVRIDNEYLGDPKAPNAEKWLEEMLRGLDIWKYSGRISPNQERIIRKRVDFMLNREYDDHGNCNIFRLRRPVAGFSRLDIWQQMQIWMNERYN